MGIYLFIISLAMTVHQQRFKKTMNDFLGDHPLMLLTGVIGTILGLLIVLCHNVWVSDWPLLVTLIGWIVLLQAIARIFFQAGFVKTAKHLMSKSCYLVWCWVWLLIGLYLIWVGFAYNG
jgi:uncharacterized protein YacL